MRPPVRRHPADEQFTAPPTAQQAGHWPPAAPYADPNGHQGQPQGYGQQQAPGYYFPQGAELDPNYGYAQQAGAQQAAYGQQPTPPQAQGYNPASQQHAQPHQAQAAPPWSQPQPDPRNFDLGNYMPAGGQGYAPAPGQGYPQQGQGYPQAGAPAEHGHFQHDPGHHPRAHDPNHFGVPNQGYAETDAEYDEPLEEDEEQPRRGRRGLMIAAALVGAIGLGGGMAYTYKTFFSGPGAGRAPLIKNADFGPNKIKPEAPGGKEFANTDKKLLNRLNDDGGQARVAGAPGSAPAGAQDSSSDDPNAPRKVKIIPISPPGQPSVTTASVPPASAPPMVAVPGVTLDVSPSAARAQMPPAATRQQMPVAAAPPPAAKAAPPVKIASAAPTSVPMAAEPAPPAKKIVAAPKNPVPKVKEASAPAAAVTSTSGTSGFVAVLSSKKSRMDALKAFADLQQKYGDVLATRTPDVQEANLGEKGMWYRAVVGPPGSRDAATGVCSQLKTAGYSGCWVTSY